MKYVYIYIYIITYLLIKMSFLICKHSWYLKQKCQQVTIINEILPHKGWGEIYVHVLDLNYMHKMYLIHYNCQHRLCCCRRCYYHYYPFTSILLGIFASGLNNGVAHTRKYKGSP